MTWLTDPFSVDFMVRALVGGSLAAVLCAVVGTWVLVRGMAFLGEALSWRHAAAFACIMAAVGFMFVGK